jgi:two-component system chemotaxis response regulator CheY
MRALVVDTSDGIRRQEREILRGRGCSQVYEARDGQEGLAVLASFEPALALVERNLPKLDGLTLVRRLREHREAMWIIMVTEAADRGSVVEAIRAGVNDYVLKPFRRETLEARIRKALQERLAEIAASQQQEEPAPQPRQKGGSWLDRA